MRWLSRLRRRPQLEAQLDAELRDHFDRLVADHVGTGLSEAEARRRARLEFGGLDQVKELCRDARGTRWLDDLGQDTGYAFRILRTSPGFASVAIVTLAIGIGANMAVFGIVNALLLRPLPVRDPHELIQLLRVQGGQPSGSFSYPQVVDLASRADLFAGLAGFGSDRVTVGSPDALEPIAAAWVSGAYYRTLGVAPAAGRLLTEDDDRPGAPPAAVISERYWEARFGRDPAAIGQLLLIENTPVPIVGVSAPGFDGAVVGEASPITLAVQARPQLLGGKMWVGPGARWLRILARPHEGVSHDQLKAALAVAWTRRMLASLPANATEEVRSRALASTLDLQSGARGGSGLRSQFREPLLASMALVTLVLLVACVNIANLLLARTTVRHREIALRLAMGAGRARIARLLLTESALLAAVGAAGGLLLGAIGARALVDLVGSAEPAGVALDLGIDWRMFAFTAAITATTTLLFGVLPALRATRVAPAAAMQAGSGRVTDSRSRTALVLVSAQVALSLLLLFGAGLFVRTLQNLRTLDRGFRHEQVLLAGIDGSRTGLTGAALNSFYLDALAFAERLRGVTAASLSEVTPLMGGGIIQSITINGQPAGSDQLHVNIVGPRYFETLQTPVVLGREFTRQDDAAAPGVVIVNEAFARAFIAGSPLGQRVAIVGGMGGKQDMQIVGVVADSVYESLRDAPPPTVYAPYLQRASGGITLIVHAPGETAAVASAIRAAIQPKLNGKLVQIRTLTSQLEGSLSRERLMAAVAGVFGVIALLLSAVGLYGLLTYWTTRRTHEVGVRMALGAQRSDVIWLVLRDAVRMLAIGAAAGIPAAWALSRFVAAMLFGVTADDAATMTVALAVLTLTGLVAAWLPARRATAVNPASALRAE